MPDIAYVCAPGPGRVSYNPPECYPVTPVRDQTVTKVSKWRLALRGRAAGSSEGAGMAGGVPKDGQPVRRVRVPSV